MTWDGYDARTLWEMDDVLETIQGYLEAQHAMFMRFDKYGPFPHGKGPFQSVLNGLMDSLADVRAARRDIQEAAHNTPEGREIARQEQPVEPVRI